MDLTKHIQKLAAGVMTGVVALALAGCVSNNTPSGNGSQASNSTNEAITVTITDSSLEASTYTTGSGTVKFSLVNKGTVKNEFEILAEDQLRIVGERENLAPGTTVDYTVSLEPGNYYVACKKNMVGSLIGLNKFTVTDSGATFELSDDLKEEQQTATTNYTAYIRDQVGQLLESTKVFADTYKSGDFEKARELYAPTRMYYERIEPTAEAFGDLDPALDEREADYQEADDKDGREWTGWHAIEKDLWRPEGFAGYDSATAAKYADQLVSDTQKLYDEVYSDDFKVNLDEISNGAIGLLEEVATSKITGEEEAFSHTDLWDFQANVEGAKVAYGNVENIAKAKDADLAAKISKAFENLDTELAQYKKGDGYQYYDELSQEQVKSLADHVNALRVVLAKLTESILS